MKKFTKIYYLFVILAVGFGFVLISAKTASANCTASVQVNLPTGDLAFNRPLTITSKISLDSFVNGGSCDGYCSASGIACFKAFYVYYDFGSAVDLSSAPPKAKIGVGNRYAVDTIDMSQGKTTPYSSSVSVVPSDLIATGVGGFKAGDSMPVWVNVIACGTGGFFTSNCTILTSSGQYYVKLSAGVYNTYACTGPDSKGDIVYICDPKNDSSCANTTGCTDKTQCQKISDSKLCGGPIQPTHLGCQSGVCVAIPGGGVADTCSPNGSACKDGGGGLASGSTQTFQIENPIGVNTFEEFIGLIGRWIFNLAIPIAVIIIIYAGVLMLSSGAKPDRFNKGRDALKYAVIGLAIVLIGKGFVTLVQSILSLKNR